MIILYICITLNSILVSGNVIKMVQRNFHSNLQQFTFFVIRVSIHQYLGSCCILSDVSVILFQQAPLTVFSRIHLTYSSNQKKEPKSTVHTPTQTLTESSGTSSQMENYSCWDTFMALKP